MNNIEAVIFDAGGVLHQENTSYIDDIVQELNLDQDTLSQIWADQISLLGIGAIDEAEFWRQLKIKHGIRQVEVTENLLGRALSRTLKPNSSIKEVIAELSAHGLALAVLSNTIEPHAQILKSAGIYDGFDAVVLSHEVGIRKPDAAIYAYTLEKIKGKPESTLFVDDNQDNVKAAQALGMKSLLFTDPQEAVTVLRSLMPATSIERT